MDNFPRTGWLRGAVVEESERDGCLVIETTDAESSEGRRRFVVPGIAWFIGSPSGNEPLTGPSSRCTAPHHAKAPGRRLPSRQNGSNVTAAAVRLPDRPPRRPGSSTVLMRSCRSRRCAPLSAHSFTSDAASTVYTDGTARKAAGTTGTRARSGAAGSHGSCPGKRRDVGGVPLGPRDDSRQRRELAERDADRSA